MNITQLIKHLETLREEHGELPCYTYGENGIQYLCDKELVRYEPEQRTFDDQDVIYHNAIYIG